MGNDGGGGFHKNFLFLIWSAGWMVTEMSFTEMGYTVERADVGRQKVG